MNKNSSRTLKVFKKIWPKLLIFSMMIVIVVFQKSPEKMKSLGQTDDSIQKQMESGEYITTAFESGPFQKEATRNILFALVVLGIYLFLRHKNQQAEMEVEMLQQAKRKEDREKENKQEKQDLKYYGMTKQEIKDQKVKSRQAKAQKLEKQQKK